MSCHVARPFRFYFSESHELAISILERPRPKRASGRELQRQNRWGQASGQGLELRSPIRWFDEYHSYSTTAGEVGKNSTPGRRASAWHYAGW